MANTKHTKTYTGKPKSIGPKFCAVLLIFILAIFSLISNLIILKTVRDEMKVAFNNEINSAVETLAGSINVIHGQQNSTELAFQMIEKATWGEGRRFWAASSDYTEILAGERESDDFFYVAEQETDFGFIVLAGYKKSCFNTYAYPKTEEFLRIATATTLILAVFALGACAIAFHRSTR